jgi:H/ACA ribonucleoprotein complex subunit 3
VAHILKCESCGSYGLEDVCSCGSKRQIIIPAKYSPEDKYGDYRRKAKEEMSGNSDETKETQDDYPEEFEEESLEDE